MNSCLKAIIYTTAFFSCHLGPAVSASPYETAGLTFLKMGGGVRAAGLGEAYSAVADDVFSIRWNSAGLAFLDGRSFGLAHNQWYQDIRQEEAVFTDRLGSFRFGLLFASQTVPGIEYRLETPTEEPIGTFSAHDFAMGFFLARALSPKIGIGGGVKWLFEKIYTDQAQGMSWDLGAIYRPRPPLSISLGLSDRGENLRMKQYDLPLPSRLLIGAAYRTQIISRRLPVLLVADYTKPRDEPSLVNAGLEITIRRSLDIRGGYSWGDRQTRTYSLGLGFKAGSIRLDYAYQPIRYDLGRVHRFGLTWSG